MRKLDLIACLGTREIVTNSKLFVIELVPIIRKILFTELLLNNSNILDLFPKHIIKQESIPVGLVAPTWKPYMLQWSPPDVAPKGYDVWDLSRDAFDTTYPPIPVNRQHIPTNDINTEHKDLMSNIE